MRVCVCVCVCVYVCVCVCAGTQPSATFSPSHFAITHARTHSYLCPLRADIDECQRSEDGIIVPPVCDPRSMCTNTPGSFTCGPCPTDYRGTGKTGCVRIPSIDVEDDSVVLHIDGDRDIVVATMMAGGDEETSLRSAISTAMHAQQVGACSFCASVSVCVCVCVCLCVCLSVCVCVCTDVLALSPPPLSLPLSLSRYSHSHTRMHLCPCASPPPLVSLPTCRRAWGLRVLRFKRSKRRWAWPKRDWMACPASLTRLLVCWPNRPCLTTS